MISHRSSTALVALGVLLLGGISCGEKAASTGEPSETPAGAGGHSEGGSGGGGTGGTPKDAAVASEDGPLGGAGGAASSEPDAANADRARDPNDAGTDGPSDTKADRGSSSPEAGTAMLTIAVDDLEMKTPYAAPVFPASASNPLNQSPPVRWSGLPASTKSIAVSMHDTGKLDNPSGPIKAGTGTKAHWVFWDIPPSTMALKANLPHTSTLTDPAGVKTTTFAGGTGYFGPGATTVNIYLITVWALDVETLPGVKAGAASQTVFNLLESHSLAKSAFLAVGTQGGIK